eukprot:2777997-Amphidinium_carterae.1
MQRDIDNANIVVKDLEPLESLITPVRRRLRGEQAPPPTLALPLLVARAHSGALVRKRINFDDEGMGHINGHAIKKEGTGPTSTLTCTLCHHHKLWKHTALGLARELLVQSLALRGIADHYMWR